MKHIQLLFVLFLFSVYSHSVKANDYLLWYDKPADKWEEALPLGNGKIGAMVFGKSSHERIQLNDDSMWPGDDGWDNPSGNRKDLDHMRELLFQGRNSEVDKLVIEKFSRKKVVRSHQTLGDLWIDFEHENITDYRRELDISKAISFTSYKTNGALVTQEVFVSKPHNLIAVRLISKAKDGLNAKIRLTRPNDKGFKTATTKATDDKLLIMTGEVTQREGFFDSKPTAITHGVKFETCLKVESKGGKVIAKDDYLELHQVQTAVFYIVSNSSYYFDDFSQQNKKDLQAIAQSNYKKIRKSHIEDYSNLYDRVNLKLESKALNHLPTNKRIELVKKDAVDLGLEAMLFNYGRYLLISSSRPGTNPANLQGLWNYHIDAPWNADYHLNINLQMNYWLANLTNLDELNLPLFDYVDKLIENGKTTATENYGCNGTYLPHASDLWAPAWMRAPTAYWGASFGAGGWMVRHYWTHYEFTADKEFLENRAYPAIKSVAEFYSDWLIEDPRDGKLVSAPSTSPENQFTNADGVSVATCLGSAMDQQIIAEVFENYIKACQILGVNDALYNKIKAQSLKLRSGYQLGTDGRILEWDREYEEPEPGHRHMSQLYGFHPGSAITQTKTPELFEGVKKTLDFRLKNGGAGTGWSRAWLINYSARLLDAEMAHEHIQLLIKKSLYINLFDAHSPFQIDGNFGYTSGVAEMLLQSHEEGLIRVLPALPKLWNTGHVKGLKARNGLEFDIYWENNQLKKFVVYAKKATDFNVTYQDKVITVDLKAGKKYTYKHK